ELLEEDQAGSDPGQSHVAQAGPNPEPMHKDFIATVYPVVHEILKLTTEEQVHIGILRLTNKSMRSSKKLFTTLSKLHFINALEICLNFK
ncbi:hypothetical protein Tco_0572012, partial [Tanacetum coccineum]